MKGWAIEGTKEKSIPPKFLVTKEDFNEKFNADIFLSSSRINSVLKV